VLVNDNGSITLSRHEIMAIQRVVSGEDLQEITLPSIPVQMVPPNRRRRIGRMIARVAVGLLVVAFGIGLLNSWGEERSSDKIIMARTLDALRVSGHKLPENEMRALVGGTGTAEGIPTYAPPPPGRESDRIAIDSLLVALYMNAAQWDIFAFGIATAVIGAGAGLIVLQPLRS
jgi:hypothetical protein